MSVDHAKCPDAFHLGDSNGEEYQIAGPGNLVMTGYRCPTCSFGTVTTGTYTPIEKPCPKCGRTFEGMDDQAADLCDDCFTSNMEGWLDRLQAARTAAGLIGLREAEEMIGRRLRQEPTEATATWFEYGGAGGWTFTPEQLDALR